VVGALDVYAAHEDRFAEAEVALARQLAEHAAVLVDHAIALQGAARLNEQLRQAMASRGTIGEAKGILAGTGPLGDHDVAAHALSERFVDLDLDHPVPYLADG